jgi:hypothetical protein
MAGICLLRDGRFAAGAALVVRLVLASMPILGASASPEPRAASPECAHQDNEQDNEQNWEQEAEGEETPAVVPAPVFDRCYFDVLTRFGPVKRFDSNDSDIVVRVPFPCPVCASYGGCYQGDCNHCRKNPNKTPHVVLLSGAVGLGTTGCTIHPGVRRN